MLPYCLAMKADNPSPQSDQSKTEFLRESEEKFFKAFHGNPCPIAISRRSDGMIMEANHAFDEWFGIPAGSASGKLSLEFGIWNCQAERDEMLKLLKEKGTVRNFQMIV